MQILLAFSLSLNMLPSAKQMTCVGMCESVFSNSLMCEKLLQSCAHSSWGRAVEMSNPGCPSSSMESTEAENIDTVDINTVNINAVLPGVSLGDS